MAEVIMAPAPERALKGKRKGEDDKESEAPERNYERLEDRVRKDIEQLKGMKSGRSWH